MKQKNGMTHSDQSFHTSTRFVLMGTSCFRMESEDSECQGWTEFIIMLVGNEVRAFVFHVTSKEDKVWLNGLID